MYHQIPEREEEKCGIEKIFEEIMTENLILAKDINYRFQLRINSKKYMPRHYMLFQSCDTQEKENYGYKNRIRGFQELGERECPVGRT
jgi:hypothetical protein